MRVNQTRHLAVSVGALLVFLLLGLQAALAKTPTADEGMHMLRAQVLRQTDELALQGQHAPLSHWVIGSFYFTEESVPDIAGLPTWPKLSGPELVKEFLWSGDTNVSRLLFLARLPVLFAGLLLGALISRWSRLLAGFTGTIVALILYAFSPNLLAFAALATTDLVFAATFIAAAFGVWFYWRRPSKVRWLLASLALGLAISSKLSGLIILPLALLLSYTEYFWRIRRRFQAGNWWRPALIWISWLPLAIFVLWATYDFELGYVGQLAFPLPASTFLANFVEVQEHIERGHFSFLLGQRSNQGWWAYFGLAYVYKTPVVAVVMLAIAVVFITWQRLWHKTAALWMPAGALFLAASASRLNIGVRHILPAVPFLWLLIAVSGPIWRRRRAGRWALPAMLVIYGLGTFRQSPHFIAYFSELVGGSSQGYRYLGDSNIDWGQDLKLLAEYVQDNPGAPIVYSYFGIGDLGYYGLNELPFLDETQAPAGIAPANPEPGRYAISVNHLQGGTTVEPDLFDWFRGQEPIDNLGYSILVFDVSEQRQGQWIAHCLDPVPALDEETAELFVDGQIMRHLYFDCRQSWVIPSGSEPGWYFVPVDLDLATIDNGLAQELERVFVNNSKGYQVLYWPGAHDVVDSGGWQLGRFTLPDGTSVGLPLSVNGLAELVGGFQNGSIWGVVFRVQMATDAPLSVLMHLALDGSELVGDGLGYVAASWQPGDVIIQFHDFGVEDGNYLATGLYDYTNGERLSLKTDGKTDSAVHFYPPASQ